MAHGALVEYIVRRPYLFRRVPYILFAGKVAATYLYCCICQRLRHKVHHRAVVFGGEGNSGIERLRDSYEEPGLARGLQLLKLGIVKHDVAAAILQLFDKTWRRVTRLPAFWR